MVDDCFNVWQTSQDPMALEAVRVVTRELLAQRIFFRVERGETNEGRLMTYALAGLRPRLRDSARLGIRAAR